MENKALIPEEDQQALETYTVGIIRLENNMAVLLKTFGKLTKEFAGPIKSLNEFNKSVDESKKAEEGLKNARTEEQRLQQEGLTLTKRVIQTNSDQVKAVQKVSKEIVEQSKATSALIAKTEAYRQKLAQVQKEAQNREGLTFIDESGNYDLTKTQAQ